MAFGIIVINGYSFSKNQKYQHDRMVEELENLGVKTQTVKSDGLLVKIEKDNLTTIMPKCDFVLFFDKDVHLSHSLEKLGYKLINNARAIENCDDKMRTYLELAGCGVKLPKTISSPLMYVDGSGKDFVFRVEKELKFPIVVKEVYGSLGKEVYLAKDEQSLQELNERLKKVPHVYQEFVGKGGEDIRVIVIGGKAICAMKRKNQNDFRSNIELGGVGESYPLNSRITEICERVAKRLNLDYCGVDLLIDGEDFVVGEVNSNAFFGGMETCTGVNVAKIFAEHVVSALQKG